MKALILMTRIPCRGKTKTRLMPDLSPVHCEELHAAFLQDYFRCFDSLPSDIHVFVAYAPENFTVGFLEMLPGKYETFVQSGENIGVRMHNAFERVFRLGYDKVVLVGCDIPHIQPGTYRNAFEKLQESDMVICPTYDGGYCLMGLKRNHKSLFVNDVRWGNQTVVEQTYNMANHLSLKVSMLDKYRDVDVLDDLMALRSLFGSRTDAWEHLPLRTLDYLENLLEEMVI